MAKESKSVRYDVDLSRKYSGKEMHKIIEDIAKKLDVYISHIGSYSQKNTPILFTGISKNIQKKSVA